MYERRLLAFLDILGWREIIRRSVDDPALVETMKLVATRFKFQLDAAAWMREWHEEQLKEEPEKTPPFDTLDVTHFSDTIVMSCPSASVMLANSLIQAVQTTATSMLVLGYYARGAIVEGLLHHDKSTIFGPALIEAYDLEKDVAKYPRILVTDEALPLVNPPVLVPGGGIERFRRVRLDADGLNYVDILGAFIVDTSSPRFREPTQERLIDECKARRDQDFGNLGLRAKHEWMIHYLESVWRESVPFPAIEHPIA
jgi:hypothetical protein